MTRRTSNSEFPSHPHNPRRLSIHSFYSSFAADDSAPSTPSDLSPRQHRERLFSDFVSRPHSAGGLARPVGPRIPGAGHKKNMREIIGFTTEEEFDRLPIAVQRKYFSTLERLRLARHSNSFTGCDLDFPVSKKRSLAERRQLRTSRDSNHSSSTSSPSRKLRKSSRSTATAAEAAWFLSLPDKIRRKHFTLEEQIRFAAGRDNVILDAADEAIYKSSRRNRNLAPIEVAPKSPSMSSTMSERPTSVALAMEESFRWMDEESDLDLRLVLDDYHANLPDVVIPHPTSHIRPSFRRHMSITKIPFGRASLSSPTSATSPFSAPFTPSHARQRSRAVSLISPKFTTPRHPAAADSPRPSIDPHAAHYQDPEARLRLRVYLASPQKFDEAIEFGFPSADGVSDPSYADRPEHVVPAAEAGLLVRSRHTFFHDDTGSLLLDDDAASSADPESPRTPREEGGNSFHHHKCPNHGHDHLSRVSASTTAVGHASHGSSSSSESAHATSSVVVGPSPPCRRPHKQSESYSLSSAGSREMTLRMTLTRPDLRTDEEVIYAWQGQQRGGERARSPFGGEGEEGGAGMRGPFEGPDGWGPVEREGGVVKRMWNRVRRGGG